MKFLVVRLMKLIVPNSEIIFTNMCSPVPFLLYLIYNFMVVGYLSRCPNCSSKLLLRVSVAT